MKGVLIFFIVYLLMAGLLVYLQIFLSKKEIKWLGLILPILSFIYSLFVLLGVGAFEAIGENNNLINSILAFFISNIPTIILLFIYSKIKKKMKMDSEIDKMNIKDL